jgi:hypothetical protein
MFRRNGRAVNELDAIVVMNVTRSIVRTHISMNLMSSLHETSAQFVHMGFDTAEGAWQAFDAYEGDTHLVSSQGESK